MAPAASQTALMALLGAGFALGVIGVIIGLRRRTTPARPKVRVTLSRPAVIRVAVAALIGAAAGVFTRWPAGAILAGIAAFALPAALGSNRPQKQALERTEAIAMWAEMLRDNLSAAAGLEQTIVVTAPHVPAAIRDDVAELAAAIRLGSRLPVALAELRERIDDPTGRLVVRALLQASQRQSRQLSELLTEMARRARDRATLRLRIEPGHAKIRTNARIIIGFTLAMAVGLVVFNRPFMQPYDTVIGQLVLIGVGLIFAAAFAGIARLARAGLEPVEHQAHVMTGPLLLGAGFGLGLALLTAWLVPARLTLAHAHAVLHPPVDDRVPTPVVLPTVQQSAWLPGLGRPAVPLLARLGLPRSRTIADLTVCGRDPAQHVATQAATALLAFLTPAGLAGLLTLGGAQVTWQAPIGAGLALAVLGLFAPDLALASEAAARRTELRDAVAAMLDLVVISLAGGAGVEQALRDATSEPDGWAQQTLRQTVEAAHMTRRPPWQTIGALGESTGVTTLSELAAALSLAGSEGARIKATLSARSAALSAHQIAEAEAAATSATERMVLPVVGLLAGFLLFIGYPAFASVLSAL